MSEEIKKLVEEINTNFGTLRSEQDAIKGKVDALDEKKLDTIAKTITDQMAEVQAKQAKLEAAMQRPNSEAKANGEFEAEQKAKFDTFLRDIKAGKGEVEIKAMSTDVNPDGGYLVRPEFANFIIDRVFETSPLRQLANVVTISSKSLEVLIDTDEADSGWVQEGGTISDTGTPELGLKEIVAHKQYANPKITEEMLQDSSIDIEAWLRGKVADKIARTENTAFVSGNGVGKPRGFLNYSAWSAAGVYEDNKIEQVNLGGASDVTADGLIVLQNALKQAYQARATWAMERSAFANVLKLKGADNYFFSQTLLKDGQLTPMLLGKSVTFMDDMPTIASNALAIAYADFNKAYTIVDRIGLSVLRDPYSTKGFVEFYTTKRTGGDVTSYDAIKLGKISS